MNTAVASYMLLVVVASSCTLVSAAAFKRCKTIACRLGKRDHRPTMLALFVSVSWVIVGINGALSKYSKPWSSLTIDPVVMTLLVCCTLAALALFIRDIHKRIHCNV